MAESETTLRQIVEHLDYGAGLINSSDRVGITPVQRNLFKETESSKITGYDSTYFSGDIPIIHFCKLSKFEKDTVREIHKKVWNQNRVPLLFVITPGEVRIYNAFYSPATPKEDIDAASDPRRLERILEVSIETLREIEALSRINLDTGKYWRSPEVQKRYNAGQRLDRHLLNNLRTTSEKLVEQRLESDVIHDLLGRCIFVSYLNDIAAVNNSFYGQFSDNANCFADVLNSKKATYELFEKLHDRFNGDTFPVSPREKRTVKKEHLEIVKEFLCGKTQMLSGQQEFWSMYNFEVIPIQLLSAIYEEFLTKREGGNTRKELSAYYTPHFLAEFIMDEVLPWPGKGERYSPETVMDISCGSGIFLVEAYRRLVEKWAETNIEPGKTIPVEDLRRILTESIFGVDKARDAVKVTAFSLYLAMLDYIEPASIWNRVRFPKLIHNPEEKDPAKNGKNLFVSDAFDEQLPFNHNKYDIIVGNPPWKRSLDNEVKNYCKKHKHIVASEISQAFLWRAADLCPNGRVAMLVSSKFLVNVLSSDCRFRVGFFKNNSVKTIVNLTLLSKDLFNDAKAPACCVFFNPGNNDDTHNNILHVVPKNIFLKGILQKILLAPPDIKFLPRNLIVDDKKIWKSALWGSILDYELLQKLNRIMTMDELSVDRFEIAKGYEKGTNPEEIVWDSSVFMGFPNLTPNNRMSQYIVNTDELSKFEHERVRRLGSGTLYQNGAKILFKEKSIKDGAGKSRVWSAFIDSKLCFNRSFYGVRIIDGRVEEYKALCVFLNSKIAMYHIFFSQGAFGIERRRVTVTELRNLPVEFILENKKHTNKLSAIYDSIASLITANNQSDLSVNNQLATLENKAFKIIADSMELNEDESQLILDRTLSSIDYFFKGEKSEGCTPPAENDLVSYCEKFAEVINRLTKYGERSISCTAYNGDSPLSVVSFKLSRQKANDIGKVEIERSGTINTLLHELDKKAITLYGKSLFVSKFFKIFDENTLYIIKPSEKRFWIRSDAITDARQTINEILV